MTTIKIYSNYVFAVVLIYLAFCLQAPQILLKKNCVDSQTVGFFRDSLPSCNSVVDLQDIYVRKNSKTDRIPVNLTVGYSLFKMKNRLVPLTLYICWRTWSRFFTPEVTSESARIAERACFHTFTYLAIVEDGSEDHQSPEKDNMEICKC